MWKIGLAIARFLGLYDAASAGVHLYTACKFQQNMYYIWSISVQLCVTWLYSRWLIFPPWEYFFLCSRTSHTPPSSLFPCQRLQAPNGGVVGGDILYLPLGTPIVFYNLSLNPPIKTSYGSSWLSLLFNHLLSQPHKSPVWVLCWWENEVQPDSWMNVLQLLLLCIIWQPPVILTEVTPSQQGEEKFAWL